MTLLQILKNTLFQLQSIQDCRLLVLTWAKLSNQSILTHHLRLKFPKPGSVSTPVWLARTDCHPLSSAQDFRIPPPPPLPKPKVPELHPSTSLHPPPLRPKPNMPELQPSSSRHPPPPFSRSITTLPRPVRISSTDANSYLPIQSLQSTGPNNLQPTIPPFHTTVHLAADYSSDNDNNDSVQSPSSGNNY